MALLSKIARLPAPVRNELNLRLENGELGPVILPWLNSLPEVRAVLDAHFAGVDVSSQNLSTWRETGYSEWQDQQEHLQFIRTATEFSRETIQATGLHLTEGGAAIAAGTLLTRIEDYRRRLKDIDLTDEDAESKEDRITAAMYDAIDKLATLRSGEIARANVEVVKDRQLLNRERHGLNKDRLILEQQKFEVIACRALLAHATSKEVQKIAAGSGNHTEKIAQLRALIFPVRPDAQGAATSVAD